MNSNESRKTAKEQRKEYDNFKEGYIRRHELFCETIPTEEDIRSTWTCLKNKNKKKKERVVPKPPITKSEFLLEYLRGCRMCNDIPKAQEFNRTWNLIEIERQYKAITGKNKKEKEKKRAAFLEQAEREIRRRYCSTRSESTTASVEESYPSTATHSIPETYSTNGLSGQVNLDVWEVPIQELHDLYSKVKSAKPETTSRLQLDQFYDQFLTLQETHDKIGAYHDAIESYLLAIETMFYCADSGFVEKSSRSYDLTRYSGKRGGRGY